MINQSDLNVIVRMYNNPSTWPATVATLVALRSAADSIKSNFDKHVIELMLVEAASSTEIKPTVERVTALSHVIAAGTKPSTKDIKAACVNLRFNAGKHSLSNEPWITDAIKILEALS